MSNAKINSINDSGSFENIMEKTSLEMREIAQELRLLIADVLPGVTEQASRYLPRLRG